MSSECRIGVAMATYNGQQYIEVQLQSIINQTLKPDVIIISDGGSDDETVDICEKVLKETDIRYQIYTSEKQLNVRENFQKALSCCDADYIFFSDQDDCWNKDKIRKTMEVFMTTGAKMVFTNALLVDQNLDSMDRSLWDTVGYKQSSKLRVYKKDSDKYLSILLQHNVITGMCMALTADIKNAVIPFSPYGIHDDWIAIVSNCLGKVAAFDEQLVNYRQHSQNVIGASDSIIDSFRRRGIYLDSVLNRMEFIKTVLTFTQRHNGAKVNSILNYMSHLRYRIEFIKRKHSILSLLSKKKSFIKYEYGYKQVLLKDIFTHIFYVKR